MTPRSWPTAAEPYPDLCDRLSREGRTDELEALRRDWEKMRRSAVLESRSWAAEYDRRLPSWTGMGAG